jgi:hypothetical protein
MNLDPAVAVPKLLMLVVPVMWTKLPLALDKLTVAPDANADDLFS